MIKALSKDGSILLLFLERGNITRLIDKNQPILIKAEQRDFKGLKEIAIAFFETPEEAIKHLAPYTDNDTKFMPHEDQ